MRPLKLLLLITMIPLFLLANDDRPPVRYDYLSKPDVQRFIRMMHTRYGFSESYLRKVFKHARLDRDTLARYTGKFKKNTTVGSWERFKLHVVNPETFKEAKAFKRKHYRMLKKAERAYGVDMDYIVGFLGVESRFGNYTGDYNILDALATLAFHKNRMQKFFKSELKHLFLFAREKKYDITKLQGSFAGAMGCVQQVPSVARRFNRDFDGDGASVWDIEDCIGSIASFMHKNRWEKGMPAVIPARYKGGKRFTRLRTSHKRMLPMSTIRKAGVTPAQPFPWNKAYLVKTRNRTHDDLWLGTTNFRVLTRYNNSANYGVAIYLIAESVK
ncbi:lytic murein transglycosylase [Sulfurovum sp. NBC37-1]|uniref:lytic murein transglycosylase n=1 Tax=Sulfurovum sp. (strain NBC37-1) TaxID=387093 RepID=UPI0001587772|nr:lytic murein transglycosylase [Sulfurovum sp. NBC37-1]BAF71936.1 membrane-bound lytic murein transglycosylase [Sulfurovum sp. NBC37-1]